MEERIQAQRVEAEAKRSAAAWRLQLVQSVLRLREVQDRLHGATVFAKRGMAHKRSLAAM